MGNINPVLGTRALKLIAEKKRLWTGYFKRIFLAVFSIALVIIHMGLLTVCRWNIYLHANDCCDLIQMQAQEGDVRYDEEGNP